MLIRLSLRLVKRVAPSVEVHLSTQQSLSNWKAAQYWKEEGLHRLVLAREASYEEMKEIKEKVDIEIEDSSMVQCVSHIQEDVR